MNVRAIKPTCSSSNYQNTKDWAIANKTKGRNATLCAVGSCALGIAKTFTEEDSLTNRVLDLGQKGLDAERNLEQYLLYGGKNDDLEQDKRNKPIAGNIGQIACAYETKVNPFTLPLSSMIGGKIGEAYQEIANWFSSIYWRLRPACEEINWDELKMVPVKLKELFDRNIEQRQKSRRFLTDNLSPFFGLIGCFCIGIFLPIKAWNKLTGKENKWIDACADGGMFSQHANYFVRFTLDELFKAQETKNKNSWYLAGISMAGNIINGCLPLIDLLPLSEKTKTLWKELAQGLGRIFFSSRRNIKGNEWLTASSTN